MDGSPALQRLVAEDALGQLWRRNGRMAALGSENGVPMLGWVDGVPRVLAGSGPEDVEGEAAELWMRGIRTVIWAGMGGSVMAVRVMLNLGLCDQRHGGIQILPLDSTDPAALNSIIRTLARDKNVALPSRDKPAERELLRELFHDVLMIGVSLGMTSEEPVTHLVWFLELVETAGLTPSDHALAMTLPDSRLDRFAAGRDVPRQPLQVDGRADIGGRMSSPTTRVFLLPAALALASERNRQGALRQVLQSAWDGYGLERALQQPHLHPFVYLAAVLSDRSEDGACRLFLILPADWKPLFPYVEQLMEEALGKDGKGVIVFDDSPLAPGSSCYRASGSVQVRVVPEEPSTLDGATEFQLPHAALLHGESGQNLAALAAAFMGWQLTMALYGYLQDIQFAGQPAVEAYKARSSQLRTHHDPLAAAVQRERAITEGPLTLLLPPSTTAPSADLATVLAQALSGAGRCPAYLDLTINGEMPDQSLARLESALHAIGNRRLGVPIKLRRAPAAYHATEQSEMDGPPGLISLRCVTRQHEACMVGEYSDHYLLAQAVATWEAMLDVGRECFLLLADGAAEDLGRVVGNLLESALSDLPPLGHR